MPAPQFSMPFEDLAKTLLHRCFAHQNPDGGLPETFPATRSGCWNSAEIYAAVSIHGLKRLCPEGAMDSLENYLSGACRNHEGRGLPYYGVKDREGNSVSEPAHDRDGRRCFGDRAGEGRARAILEFLIRELDKPSLVEEDEFPTRAGLMLPSHILRVWYASDAPCR